MTSHELANLLLLHPNLEVAHVGQGFFEKINSVVKCRLSINDYFYNKKDYILLDDTVPGHFSQNWLDNIEGIELEP